MNMTVKINFYYRNPNVIVIITGVPSTTKLDHRLHAIFFSADQLIALQSLRIYHRLSIPLSMKVL